MGGKSSTIGTTKRALRQSLKATEEVTLDGICPFDHLLS